MDIDISMTMILCVAVGVLIGVFFVFVAGEMAPTTEIYVIKKCVGRCCGGSSWGVKTTDGHVFTTDTVALKSLQKSRCDE